MLEYLLIAAILGIGAAFLTNAFLLEEKESHEGPFIVPGLLIRFGETGHLQRFSLFDAIRYVLGVYLYKPNGGIISTRDNWWYEMWTCPDCLSFWASLPFTVALFLLNPHMFLYPMTAHFVIAGVSLVINRYLNV